MAENSAIEWTDHTFNPWLGCTKISPACDHCYAEGWAKRTGQAALWQGERRRTSEANWREPLKWNKKAREFATRYRVFCASLADVFDNQVPQEWRRDLWALIAATPSLDWLLLTKRPQNIDRMLPHAWNGGWPNVWLGTTVENQEEAERRIPHLLQVPAHIRFLSCEPLLGPLDLTAVHIVRPFPGTLNAMRGTIWPAQGLDDLGVEPMIGPRLDWIIAGGESGPGARPAHPDWARGLRDQCRAADVAFFWKQWGDWTPFGTLDQSVYFPQRVGKKAAGRLLDGVTHDEYPPAPSHSGRRG